MNTPFNDFVAVSNETIVLQGTEVESYMPFAGEDAFTVPVEENELSGDALRTAIELNTHYMNEYKWRDYGKRIMAVLGFNDDSWIRNSWQENIETFTKTFAAWQEKNGYKTSLPGVFGLNNWTYFQKKLGLNNLGNDYGIEVQKAISGNKRYESNWNYAKSEILQYLNNGLPLNEEYFAYMIAKFQKEISPDFNNNIKVDGILGNTTWDILRTRIEKASPSFDIKQHLHIKDTKAATERYVEELIKYSTFMINALSKIQEDINTYVRNEPIEFETGKEIIYTIANSVVGAVPVVGATGNALLDLNKEYWKNVQENIDRQFDKQRSLKLTELIYVLKNQLMGHDSKSVIQHSLDDKIKYSGKTGDQVFRDFTNEIERIAKLNRSPDEILKIAFSNLIAAFSHQTRVYIHCQNTTDIRNWTNADVSNLLNDTSRKRLNVRFTNVHPSIKIPGNNLTPSAIKNLTVLWELAKTYRFSFKDIKVKKDIFFSINFPFSINLGMYNSSYSVGLSMYIKTLQPEEDWNEVRSILDIPFNKYWLPYNVITYKDDLNSLSIPITAMNNKGFVYHSMILEIVNSVMNNEYSISVATKNIGLISSEAELSGIDIPAEIIDETNSGTQNYIEGRTSWAKSILNNLLAIKLVINNTVDESTRDSIAIFQSRNNLPQTRNIDFVTERALLEADAIFRQVPSAASIITTAKTKIEDWTKQGMSGVKTKPQHILNSFRDPRKLWAFVLHQMAFKRKGGANKQYSAPEGYVNTGAHFCIMLDGRIIQLHPLSRMIWHGNCVSPRSVAVEFEGNFPNVKGTWWYDRSKYKTAPDKDQPTPAQYEAGRFLASYLKVVVGTTHILAHRQSSDSRENDPGPDIWYNVGEWSMQNLALTDGGSSFKCGSGNPILPEWRTWGNRSGTISNEDYVDFEEEMDWEAYDEEAMQDDPGLIKEDVDENEDFFFEDNEFINTADAIRLNRYYASKLGWGEFHYQINDFLLPYAGQQNVSLDEEAFAQAVAVWQAQQKLNADGIIGPDTWAKMKAFLFPQTSHPVQPVRTSSPVDTRTVDKIQSFKSDIDSISNRYAFNSNITRGIIAAESGGNAKSGEGTSGYKGLMQAETDPEQLKPAVSIETGIKKFIAFRDKTLNVWLKGLGIPIPLATDENYLRLCLSCYNAGPVTALKAVQYAHAAGDWRQWLSAEFYLRALLFSGGYAQYSTCNKGKSSQAIADAKAERIRYRFKTSAWRSEPDPPAWTSIMSSLNPVMRCWIETKYTNTPGYLEKFIRYFNYFEQNKSVHETEAFDNYLYEDAAIHSHENYSDDEHAIVEDSFFLNEGVDEFDHLFEADEFINDRSKAINLNRHYQQKLGWNQYQQQINDFLLPYSGLQNVSLGEETFAEAVAVWQQQQGLTADGVIGPNTWNRMKISLNLQPPVQVVNPSPVSNRGTAPSVQHIFDFNRWHAQIVLDSMNNGIIGSSFKSKEQLQKIIRGEAIMSIDPRDQLIQALPVMSHICSEATRNNYREIIIGSFIRGAQPDGTCGGHCKGRCIDINYKGGSFATAGAVQMVVNILGYLKNLSPEYKKSFGFGLPLQGNFFGKKALKKFKGTSHLNLVDPQLQAIIPSLGIVFPDNDNHLHIQVSWA